MTVFGKVLVRRCRDCGTINGEPHRDLIHIGESWYPNWEDPPEAAQSDHEFSRSVDAALAPPGIQPDGSCKHTYRPWFKGQERCMHCHRKVIVDQHLYDMLTKFEHDQYSERMRPHKLLGTPVSANFAKVIG